MKPVTILNPKKLVFGNGSFEQFVSDIIASSYKRIFLVTFKEILPALDSSLEKIKKSNKEVYTELSIVTEPSFEMFGIVKQKANDFRPDCVVGIGGGSVLDVAKLVTALLGNEQTIDDIIGINNLKSRSLPLICLPTTSGTGSEMSPNAILLDETDKLKKGIISPFLVADVAYIDPKLTLTVPAAVTAATGLDALTHCIEAYTNKFAHPVVDQYALEGIKLIGQSLRKAYKDGSDIQARTDLALGSMYGGMCLGPVNTAAVHALSYPLGSSYKIAHGLSNALLLPHIMRFNLPAVVEKYSKIAMALGVESTADKQELANKGIEKITELSVACNVPQRMSDILIPESDIENLAESAMKVQRLLVNNPREVTLKDALAIYKAAF